MFTFPFPDHSVASPAAHKWGYLRYIRSYKLLEMYNERQDFIDAHYCAYLSHLLIKASATTLLPAEILPHPA